MQYYGKPFREEPDIYGNWNHTSNNYTLTVSPYPKTVDVCSMRTYLKQPELFFALVRVDIAYLRARHEVLESIYNAS